jgi:hypothetical protein
MATVPDFLLRHRVTIEPYQGEGAYGPTYGTPVANVPAFVDDVRRLVRTKDGDEVISETTIVLKPTVDCPDESRVTIWAGTARERTARAVQTSLRDGGGLPTPDHLAVALL